LQPSIRWKRDPMSDLEQFRKETRAWLEANCPPEMRKPATSDGDVLGWPQHEILLGCPARLVRAHARQGLDVPDWPKEYGGGGLDGAEHKVLREEMGRIGARSPLSSFGIWMLGPALLKFGNEAQKKEHLPKIAAASSAGARAIPSRTPAPTSPRCRPAPKATATTSSSPARRSGPPTPTTPTGSSAWCAPILRPRSMTASASFCSTWPRRACRPSRSC
jgi:hypothetical protein